MELLISVFVSEWLIREMRRSGRNDQATPQPGGLGAPNSCTLSIAMRFKYLAARRLRKWLSIPSSILSEKSSLDMSTKSRSP